MPPRRDIYSPFADPNSFLGQPFLPKVGQAISRGISNVGQMASTVGGALKYPFTASSQALGGASEAFRGTPLISGPALGRTTRQEPATPMTTVLPSGTPMVGFDMYPTQPQPTGPRTIGTGRTVSTAQVIAQNNANMTDYERGLYGFMSLTPSSRNVVSSVSNAPATGIVGGQTSLGIAPSIDQGVASARFGAIPVNQPPIAPITMGVGGATERKGVQTAYGMIYPSAGQEAGAQKSAALGPMGARLANVGQEMTQAQRLAMVKQNALIANAERTRNVQKTIAQNKANPATYTAGSGARIAAPTDRFGRVVAAFSPMQSGMVAGTAQEQQQPNPFTNLNITPISPILGEPLNIQFGGPQSMASTINTGTMTSPTQYSNARAEERKRINELSRQVGFPTALNAQTRGIYANYFRGQGLL